MPMYEYRCDDCGNLYEELRRMSEADLNLKCPACGSEVIQRMVSAFATGGCTPTAGGGFS